MIATLWTLTGVNLHYGRNLRFEGLFALIRCKFDCNAVDTNLVLIYTMGVNLRFEGLFALIRCKFDWQRCGHKLGVNSHYGRKLTL